MNLKIWSQLNHLNQPLGAENRRPSRVLRYSTVWHCLYLFIYIYLQIYIHVHFADPKNHRLMGSRQLFDCAVVVKPHVLLRIWLVLTSRPCKGVNHHHWICVQEIRNFYTIQKSRTFLPGAIPRWWSIGLRSQLGLSVFCGRSCLWQSSLAMEQPSLLFVYTVRWFWIWKCFSKLNRVPLKFDVYQHVSCLKWQVWVVLYPIFRPTHVGMGFVHRPVFFALI